MASSQKVILTLLFLNFLIVLLPLLATVTATQSELENLWSRYETATREQDERVDTQLGTDDDGGISRWFQKTWAAVGDFGEGIFATAALAVGFLWVFVVGMLPLGVISGVSYSGIPAAERIIIYTFEFFRMTLMVLIGLEVFLILRNRKTGA